MKQIITLAKDLYQLKGSGDEYAYLLLGSYTAALIDTTAGYGDVLHDVRTLTDLPLLVLNTHGHVDHAGGNYCFKEVWLHSNDLPLMKEETTIERRLWFLNKIATSHNELKQFHRELLKEPCPIQIHFLEEGMCFDLGNIKLECLFVPGHTTGSVAFFDRENGRLFGGDSFHDHVQIFFDYSAPIEVYRNSVKKMLDLPVETIYAGHGKTPLEKDCLEQLLIGCDRILSGKDGIVLPDDTLLVWPQQTNGDRIDGLHGNIYYKK